ncbi:hypothetical protein DFH28DRAFT_395846 [Melampsora americana]|nr:hypothetical protein DFH28DRAFT_395846 [Melampsora americana]
MHSNPSFTSTSTSTSTSSTPLLSIQNINPNTRRYTLRTSKKLYGSNDAIIVVISSTLFALTTWSSIFTLLGLIILGSWIYSKLNQVHSETVLVLGTLGIQLSQSTLLRTQHEFIPSFQLQQVIIHESIDCWNIEFYLAMVIDRGESETDLVEMEVRRIFKGLRPGLEYIVPVWDGIRELMFDEDKI